MVVHAPTKPEHDRRVAAVEAAFRRHNVRVNPDKCVRGARSLQFLGYIVSRSGIQIDPQRIAPLIEGPVPSNARELQAFLGSVSYHARFVPGFSTLVEPLRVAVRADPFVWTDDLSSLVQEVQRAIASAPALSAFDPSRRTILTCDASDVGCGARLSQSTNDGLEEVVSYASKTFSQAEQKYSVVEKEALGCVWAVEKWRPYLWGRRFTIRTDHQALCSIYGLKGSNRVGRRVARWEARLSEYSFEIEYLPSARNLVADGLSRLPLPVTDWDDDDSLLIAHLTIPAAISEAEMCAASAADPTLSAVRDRVAGSWPRSAKDVDAATAPFFAVRQELSCKDSLLFRGERLVVPTALRAQVISNAHEAHQGLVRTKQRLRGKFWWPGMEREAQTMLQSCVLCSAHEAHVKPCRPPLQPIPLPVGVWRKVMVDLIGPLQGPAHERFGIVLVDMYSRWPEVAFCANVTADTLISFLRTLFSREGVPEELVSDNGPQFRSAALQDFLRRLGVRHIFSSTYSPQTCGMVERFNRTVKDAILAADMLRQPRALHVQVFLSSYRATVHPATGLSPFRAMRGREMRTVLDIVPVPEVSGEVGQQVADRARNYQAGYKQRYDARRSGKFPSWKRGDRVRVRNPRTGKVTGEPAVSIQKQTGPVSFRLEDGQRVHARRLFPAPVSGSQDEVVEPFLWPGEDEGRPMVRAEGQQRDPSTPRRGTPPPAPAVPVIPRRSQRTPRPPVRFSP